MDHSPYIRRAIELARDTTGGGNPPFGSLLVHDAEIVQTAVNTTVTNRDITGHPELKLARWAASEYDTGERGEITMYTSTEPCPMCSAGIYYAGIGQVVYSVTGTTLEAIRGDRALALSCEEVFGAGDRAITVTGPVLESEGRLVLEEYYAGG